MGSIPLGDKEVKYLRQLLLDVLSGEYVGPYEYHGDETLAQEHLGNFPEIDEAEFLLIKGLLRKLKA